MASIGTIIINKSTGIVTYADAGWSDKALSRCGVVSTDICICTDDEISEGDMVVNMKNGNYEYVKSVNNQLIIETREGFMFLTEDYKLLESTAGSEDMVKELAENMRPFMSWRRDNDLYTEPKNYKYVGSDS